MIICQSQISDRFAYVLPKLIYQIFPFIKRDELQTIITGGNEMKNSLGLVTATALYCSMSNNSLKKAKRAFVNKIEDIIM